MAVSDDIARVELKVDEVIKTASNTDKCVTELSTRLENYPDKVKQIDDHEKRLTALETLETQDVIKRLSKVETQQSRFLGWIAGATAVAAAVGAAVTWALTNLAGKL